MNQYWNALTRGSGYQNRLLIFQPGIKFDFPKNFRGCPFLLEAGLVREKHKKLKCFEQRQKKKHNTS